MREGEEEVEEIQPLLDKEWKKEGGDTGEREGR